MRGHSTSVAHLVDNELPISTLHSPADPMNLTPTDDNEAEDDGMENLSNRNNLSGSYSNLFRDMLEDDDSKLNSTEQKNHQKMSENVYSNIPTTTSPTSGINHCSDNSEKSDPNLHVYSNIVETTPATSVDNLNKSIGSSNSSIRHVDTTLIDGSSTMISNDLDLDDPAMAVATFGMMKPKDTSKVVNEKLIKERSSLNKRTPKSISMEMKNVIPQVAIMDQSSNGVNGNNTAISNTSNAFCSPSRMRLLHDTTMIDTALDLDSLDDGSSVGNNSQACLVKTAIV